MELAAEPNCLLPAGFHDADGGIVFFSSGDVGLKHGYFEEIFTAGLGAQFCKARRAHNPHRPQEIDRAILIARRTGRNDRPGR